MMVKDAIKEELLKLIKSERDNLDKRLIIGGDTFEISCEEKFLNKIEDFANSI